MGRREDFICLGNLLDEGDIILYVGWRGDDWHGHLSEIKDRLCFHSIRCMPGGGNDNDVEIDGYCNVNSIPHVNFLILDIGHSGMARIVGKAQRFLENESIDYIWFECEGVASNGDIYPYLESQGYCLFRVTDTGSLEHVSRPAPDFTGTDSGRYLAVSGRLYRYVINDRKGMFNYAELFEKYGVSPGGVIHVGAHHGEEIDNYRSAGVKKMLMIEADPKNYHVLSEIYGAHEDIITVNALASDAEYEAEFHRMSSSQSSSMFDLKEHSRIYRSIRKTETIRLHAVPLDRLIDKLGVDENEYNILALDVQGAELKVLHGAGRTLNHINAIITEVNYKELYQGAAFIWEMDGFLEGYGFKRVEAVSPHHPSWGDAFYIKNEVI